MREYAPFLAHQLARFGVLTVQQMLALCQGRCKRSSVYRLISGLRDGGYVVRGSHPTKTITSYTATRKLYPIVYGPEHRRPNGVHPKSVEHAIACATVMIEMSRYSGVTGIATEHEVCPEEIKSFCYGRIPDGIIRVTQGDLSYELAVEVEHTLKSERETALVLSQYRQSILRNMPCVGAIIVAGTKGILAKYQAKLSELPKEIEERILLTTLDGLNTLNPTYYGQQGPGPGPALEKLRTNIHGRPEYICAETKETSLILPPFRGPVSLGGSAF